MNIEEVTTNRRRPPRWSGGSRYSPVEMIHLGRWVNKKGGWRLVEKQVSEIDYCFLASNEKPGYKRGARIAPRFNTQHTTGT